METHMTPFAMVIFGATGDLTARKLMPALYSLLSQGVLPKDFFVVGFGRRELTPEQFRSDMRTAIDKAVDVPVDEAVWSVLSQNITYVQGMFEEKEGYERLVSLLKSYDDKMGACITRFFYLATPPEHYETILKFLDSTKLSEGCGQGSSKWTRVLIEKPFGKDFAEAQKLEELLSTIFAERQIYRIDHYLAKETVQNILVFRFGNGLFEPVWNANTIDNIQITIAESGGVGKRGLFYEGVGALKDVAQNHLMALLAYVAMEEPVAFTADAIRAARNAVLSQISIPKGKTVEQISVRGQYAGYRNEPNVTSDSQTDTFAAFTLEVKNRRWATMPFYLRTGKKLARDEVRIDIQFKQPGGVLFPQMDGLSNPKEGDVHTNVLTIWVQPREEISLRMLVKAPGLSYKLAPADMEFSYARQFKRKIEDSYEKVLVDAMVADQTLFATRDGFASTWKFITAIADAWEKGGVPLVQYEPGNWGPKEADALIQKDGRHWILE